MTLKCVICGSTFEYVRRGGATPTICGSAECRRLRHTQYSVDARWRKRGGAVTQTRVCQDCETQFEFVRVRGDRGSGPGFCSDDCREASRLRNSRKNAKSHRARLAPEERSRRRRVALLARYGLTPERFDAMVAEQDGLCAVCRKTETKHHSPLLKIDHDRSCCPGHQSCGNCVRGLLCSNCNRALGLLGDDPEVLSAAIQYLSRVRTSGAAALS